MKMKISTFGYTIKQGIKNIWTNKMFSIASIATMAACIFMFGMFYAIVANFQHVVKDVESSVAITVFFDEGTTQDEIDEIGQKIAMRPEVSSFNFVSADEAWAEYKLEYFDGDEAAAASFGSDNPLSDKANYEIYMEDISQQSSLVSYLEGQDHISKVRQSEMVANTLTDFNRLIHISYADFHAFILLGFICSGCLQLILCIQQFFIFLSRLCFKSINISGNHVQSVIQFPDCLLNISLLIL